LHSQFDLYYDKPTEKASTSSDIFPAEDPASSYNILPGQVKDQKEQVGTRPSRSNSKLQ